MNKSRKARENSFRYQRVDLSREDSTDSEDDLDKILGPSTSPSMHNGTPNKPKKRRNNKCAIYCSMAMLLLTFSVFGGVMIFATVVYPGGIREALARTQIFHFDGGENGKNITSSVTNGTNDTNATKTEVEDYELSKNISNWINSNYTESSENIGNYTSEIKQNGDNEKLDIVEEEKNVKNQTVVEETKNDNLDLQSTSDDDRIKSDDQLWDFNPNPQDSDFQDSSEDSQRVKKYDSDFDFDEYDFYDGHDMKYQDTVSDYPIYTALESRPDVWTPSFGQPSSTEKQINEEVQIEHSKEALNENITETFINDQKEDNSSKFNRVVEDSQDSGDGNGTVAEKQGDLISNDTTNQIEDKPDGVSVTAWSQELWLQYRDNNMALLVSFAVFSTISVLFLATCCLCRRKSRDRAKKKHFQRLVSDLNAQEKFTLVTPSDDENSD